MSEFKGDIPGFARRIRKGEAPLSCKCSLIAGNVVPNPECPVHVEVVKAGSEDYRYELLCWAVDKWNAEVLYRPVQNVHRRGLDDTWRTVIRKLGGDPELLLKLPNHDTMVQQHPEAFRERTGATAPPKEG